MKKIYLVSVLSMFSLNLFCQVHWSKYPDNPVMVPGPSREWDEEIIEPGSVIYYDNMYQMWYTYSKHLYPHIIGHATSPDGISWTKDTNNPVLDVGQEGDWDDKYISVNEVLVIDSIFHMWYTELHYGNPSYCIGHATSPDGVTWTKDTNNPVLEKGEVGAWDDVFVYASSVKYDGSEYHMWYGGWDATVSQVGHATSPDGINWTKDPQNPVLTGEAEEWDYPSVTASTVLFDNNTYHMWYEANRQIGYATSEDGVSWEKDKNNPVFTKGSTGSWDSYIVSSAQVIDSSGVKYKMWYSGRQNSIAASIGYAESSPFVDIPDTAFLHALIEEGVNTNGDSLISYSEAEASDIYLDVSRKGILNVTGIEAFENLWGLSCSENQLTVLAVSNNTALRELNCSGNLLSHLDLSNNKNIRNSLEGAPGLVLNNMPTLGEVCVWTLPLDHSVDTTNSPNVYFSDCVAPEIQSIIEKFLPVSIYVSISENGCIYAVPEGTEKDIASIQAVCRVSIATLTKDYVLLDVSGLDDGVYWLYAKDLGGNISEPVAFNIIIGGIENKLCEQFRIFPNPVQNLLSIETNGNTRWSVELTSLKGQVLYTCDVEADIYQLDLSSYPKGVYFITIRSKDFVTTRKIIKH